MKDLKSFATVTFVLYFFTLVTEGSFIPTQEFPDDTKTKDVSGEDLGNMAGEEQGHHHFLKIVPAPKRQQRQESFVTSRTEPPSKIDIEVDMFRGDGDPLTDSALNIPGVPGVDYPIFNEVPLTGFHCQEQRYKGFFADMSTNCQAWHYCDFSDGQSTFLCPNGTLFSQVLLTCDWWFNVNCHEAQQLYVLNESLYRYVKTPKPTFPEDYHGPEVDLWLKRQVQLGILPKMPRNKFKLVDKERRKA